MLCTSYRWGRRLVGSYPNNLDLFAIAMRIQNCLEVGPVARGQNDNS